MLWQQEVWHPTKDNEAITWLPIGGGDTQMACQAHANLENDAWARYQKGSVEHQATIKDQLQLDVARNLNDVDRVWLCAPVGADPHGPKAGPK